MSFPVHPALDGQPNNWRRDGQARPGPAMPLVIRQRAQLNRIEAEASRFPELLELVGERSRLSIPSIVFTVEPEV